MSSAANYLPFTPGHPLRCRRSAPRFTDTPWRRFMFIGIIGFDRQAWGVYEVRNDKSDIAKVAGELNEKMAKAIEL